MTSSNRLQRTATLAVLSCFFAMCGLSTLASAQYVGPSALPIYKSVADILKNPIDDHPAVLDGYLVKQVGAKTYLFSDGSAEIRVEIDFRLFPSTPVTEKTRVRIRGEVEKDFLRSPEIEVDSLEIIK